MKKKIFTVLLAVVLVCSFSLVTAAPVAATVHQVNPGESIQDAINAAGVGDIIIVAAGTYNEQVVINKSLTLQGTGDTTIIQPSGAGVLTTVKDAPWSPSGTKPMAAIVFVDTAGTVTVKDLKIDGSLIAEAPPEVGVNWVAGLSYLETSGTIEGLTVIGNLALTCRNAGIWASAITSTSSVEVTRCNVIDHNRAGIYALGEKMTADYHHNVITGPGGHDAQVPNGMFFLQGATGSATYNTITALEYQGEEYRSSGIGTYYAGTGITFAYNTIFNVQNAFALAKDTSGTVVEYNNIFNNHTGVRIENGANNNIIRYNDIHDNDFAIRCGKATPDGSLEMGPGNVAHFNNFVNNPGLEYTNVPEESTYVGAVCNLSSQTLDATNNWWGTKVKSEIEAMVSPNVGFDPWLTSHWPSQTVGLTATPPPEEIIGISVLPSEIDFGAISGGASVLGDPLTVTNIGNVLVDVDAEMKTDTAYDNTFFYTAALRLNGKSSDKWETPTSFGSWIAADLGLASIAVEGFGSVTTELVCPSYLRPGGTYTGTILFVATLAE